MYPLFIMTPMTEQNFLLLMEEIKNRYVDQAFFVKNFLFYNGMFFINNTQCCHCYEVAELAAKYADPTNNQVGFIDAGKYENVFDDLYFKDHTPYIVENNQHSNDREAKERLYEELTHDIMEQYEIDKFTNISKIFGEIPIDIVSCLIDDEENDQITDYKIVHRSIQETHYKSASTQEFVIKDLTSGKYYQYTYYSNDRHEDFGLEYDGEVLPRLKKITVYDLKESE